MEAAYDAFAEKYQRAKQAAFRIYLERPSHMAALGDVRGLRVLDLACGDGFLTREIAKAGAAEVVGVDISGEMIALAERAEAERPLGIRYRIAPVQTMVVLGEFDVVSAGYLLCNAADRSDLGAMARAIASNLVPGGRFVTTDSELWTDPAADYRPYGMTTEVPCPHADGQSYRITFHLAEGDAVTIVNQAHRRETIDAELAAAGFRDVRRLPLLVTEEGRTRMGEDYWTTYLTRPPIVVITAVRD